MAVVLDATGEYLSYSGTQLDARNDYTWMAYVKTTTGSAWQGLLSFSVGEGGTQYESCEIRDTNDWGLYAMDNQTSGGGSVSTATWYHIAMVKSGTTLYLYVNGSALLTINVVADFDLTTGTMLWGHWSAGSDQLYGRMSYSRAWTSALSAAQISAESASATPIITANLWGDWPLQTNGNDNSGNGRNLTTNGTATFSTTDEPISSGITGTVTRTLAAATVASAGTVTGTPSNSGTVNRTLDALTASSAGVRSIGSRIAHIESATNSRTSGTSTTVTLAAQPPAGALLIAAHWNELANPTVTPPTGFQLLFQQNYSTLTANLAVFYKVATGSEGTSFAFSSNATSEAAVGISVFFNAAVPTVYNVTTTANSVNNNAPTVDTGSDYAWALHIGGSMYGTTRTDPTSFTELFDRRTGTAAGNCMVALSYREYASPTTTGTVTATLANADNNVGALVVVPRLSNNGTTTRTLAAATLSATGVIASGITGAVTRTLDAATLSAAGTIATGISGTVTRTLDAATAGSAGTVAVKGTTAKTLAAVTLSATNAAANPQIGVGNGFTDVSPRQLVRTSGDRLYAFLINCDSYPDFSANGLSQAVHAYRSTSTGVPTSFAEQDSSNAPAAATCVAVAIDGSDNVHVAWTARSASNLLAYLRYAVFSTATNTWGGVTTIVSNLAYDDIGQGDQSVALALDASGNAHIVYLSTAGNGAIANRRIYYTNNSGGTWSAAAQLDTGVTYSGNEKAWHPNIAFDNAGRILVAWERGSFNDGSDGVIYTRVYSGSWGSTVQASAAGDSLITGIDQSTSLLVSPNNTYHLTYVLYSATNSQKYIRYRYSTDNGATWSGNNPTNQATHNPALAWTGSAIRIFGHGTPDGSNHGQNIYYFEIAGNGGAGTWSSWTLWVTDATVDSSVNTRWSQYFHHFPTTLDIAYWDDAYPNYAYVGTQQFGQVTSEGTAAKTLDAATLSAVGSLSSTPTTGTLAATLATATGAATGTVDVIGVTSATLTELLATGAGAVPMAGAGAATLSAVVAASSAAVAVIGVSSIQLDAASGSGTATAPAAGATSTTLANVTALSVASVTITGTTNTTLAPVTLLAGSQLQTVGTLDATLAGALLDAAGTIGNAPATGTLARTLADLALAALGTLPVTGTASSQLADVTPTATGAALVAGTLAVALADATLLAGSQLQTIGTLVATLDDLTGTATAVSTIQATLARTLDDVDTAGAGAVPNNGSVSQTLAPVTLLGGSAIQTVGTLDATFADATLAATGTLGASPVVGTLVATLDVLTATGTVTAAITGSAIIALNSVTVAAAGIVAVDGSSTSSLAALSSDAAGSVHITGTLDKTLASVLLFGGTSIQAVGTLSALLEDAGLTGAVAALVTGATTQQLASVDGSATGLAPIRGASDLTLASLGAGALATVSTTAVVDVTLGALTLSSSATFGVLAFIAVTLSGTGSSFTIGGSGEQGHVVSSA